MREYCTPGSVRGALGNRRSLPRLSLNEKSYNELPASVSICACLAGIGYLPGGANTRALSISRS